MYPSPPHHPPRLQNQNGPRFQIVTGRCTMKQVDLTQMDNYPADSCAISPMAFLFQSGKTRQNVILSLRSIYLYYVNLFILY